MLFNSFEFILFFLPLVLLVYYQLQLRSRQGVALYWLVLASLFFYGWWKPEYLLLIVGSVVFNYKIGELLTSGSDALKRPLLYFSVAANLASIGYFKYANFFVDNLNAISGSSYHLETIILPLAISFFTFQQITYLIDAYRGETEEHNFRNYALFVTFFPQLIAGPIVHHKEMLPQFLSNEQQRFCSRNLIVGLTIFVIGLVKKVVIADGVAPYSNSVFTMAEAGETIFLLEAWTGAIAYSLQIYFDFSGYSDMAIGIARMFGIVLPINFNSPYKSTSIVEFWRRWHMTLSRFLRDYLYFSLGGNRKGPVRRQVNLLTTMLLGGLWHGAGWTFIIWGGLHGLFLIINHGWRSLRVMAGLSGKSSSMAGVVFARTITLLCIVVAWVYFRAESVEGAHQVLSGMAGFNGMVLAETWRESSLWGNAVVSSFATFSKETASLGLLFAPFNDVMQLVGVTINKNTTDAVMALASMMLPLFIALAAPNSLQLLAAEKPVLQQGSGDSSLANTGLIWKNNVLWAVLLGLMAAYAAFGTVGTSQFLYFNF